MRCVILSACPVSPELKRLLRPDDFIIACDAGYRNCAPLDCKPNIILGDFDTAPCPVQQNDDIIVLPHVKDDTDTEYAAKLASEKGFTEVLLLGVLGGRRMVRRPWLVFVSPISSSPALGTFTDRRIFSVPAFSSKSCHMRPQISPRRRPVVSSV